MFKKYLVVSLIVLVFSSANAVSVFAQTGEVKEAKQTENVKKTVSAHGIGQKAKLLVKLKDGTKLKGYVSEINDENFVVVNKKTGATTVLYSQVKGTQYRIPTALAIVIAAGTIVGLLVVIGELIRAGVIPDR